MRSSLHGDSLMGFWFFEDQETQPDGKDRLALDAGGWMWASYSVRWTLHRFGPATWAITGDGVGYGAGSTEGDGPGAV